ncbi:hypothetical protein [Nannocystis radixulma]|uniref:NIPSNAP domain-containing protein n=1 Tax=Nannocystis radixulma TaxID=2995305 RepID=A0ABT5B1X4_9BACT|nr:hypothetical protein [Nannocystis radixulma]MDC0668104.1 hypothetical protein [Nannocystis radixulma]
MSYSVRAFPLCRPVGELMAFVAELQGPRRAEAEAAYRRYGVLYDSWHLQHTPHGPWVLVVTMVESRAKIAEYAASTGPFDVWFKSTILELSGCDPNEMPFGPPTTEILEWTSAKMAATCAGIE